MAKKKKKSTVDFEKLRNYGFLFFAICNIILTCYVFYRTRKEFKFNVNYIEEKRDMSVLTNFLKSVNRSSSSLPVTNSLGSVNVSSDIQNVKTTTVLDTVNYQYMEVAGIPCIFYCGLIYYQGDICSYGCIERIFPDRLFVDGKILLNKKYYERGS